MTKTATQRDATIIRNLAKAILAKHEAEGSVLTSLDRDRLRIIVDKADGIDASTGRRDSSTKSRRSRAAKKSSSQAVRKSAKRKAKA